MDSISEKAENIFDAIKKSEENGGEFWSARDLMPILGYGNNWHRFMNAIQKAKIAAVNSGYAVDNHFYDAVKMVRIGYGNVREVPDYLLTRYACYLIAQNADPRKAEVAKAMTYFAQQTYKQEIYEKLTPEAKRLLLRGDIVINNKRLNSAAKSHGVVNYALFHDAGYKGLYGKGLRDITRDKNIGKDKLLDRAGATELAANLFRITQTEDRLLKDAEAGKRHGQRGAEGVHFMIGGKVRETIKDIGGTVPEQLPPEPHIKELKKRIKADEKRKLGPSEKPLKIDNPEGFDNTIGKIIKSD